MGVLRPSANITEYPARDVPDTDMRRDRRPTAGSGCGPRARWSSPCRGSWRRCRPGDPTSPPSGTRDPGVPAQAIARRDPGSLVTSASSPLEPPTFRPRPFAYGAVRSVSDALPRGAGFVLKTGGSTKPSLVRDGLAFKCPRLRSERTRHGLIGAW